MLPAPSSYSPHAGGSAAAAAAASRDLAASPPPEFDVEEQQHQPSPTATTTSSTTAATTPAAATATTKTDEEETTAPASSSSDADDIPVSLFIQLYVKHARVITLLHVAFVVLCCVFALPFFDLSDPEAGLRLRDDVYADRGDGLYAAADMMVPDGFGNGISGAGVQTVFKERTQGGSPLLLYWYLGSAQGSKGKSVLEQPGALQEMRQLEDAIAATVSYSTELCQLINDGPQAGQCVPMRTPTATLLAQSNVPLLYAQDKFFFPASASSADKLATLAYTRVLIPIGSPLANFSAPSDRQSQQQRRVYDVLQRDILPLVRSTMDRLRGSSSSGGLRLTYFQVNTRSIESTDILTGDLGYAAVSVSVVFLSLWWHFFSLVLALGAILQVVVSFPIALFFYRLMLGIELFGGLHVISIFLIIGIGIDDCFVLFDSYDQVTRQHPQMSLSQRLERSYRLARYTMFATTLTTFLCFLSMVSCAVPVLRWFGVFCSLLVVINYALCITLFLGIICLYDQYVKRSGSRQRERAVVPFGERWLVFVIADSIMRHKWRRNAVLLVSLAFIILMSAFASQLQPSESIDSFYPVGHAFRDYEEIVSTGFVGDAVRFASAVFMNGLQAPFRTGYDFANDGDFGQPVFDADFNLAAPQVQQYLVDQCLTIRAAIAEDTADKLHGTNETSCPMVDFKLWLESKGLPFPVLSEAEFDHRLLEYYLQPHSADFQIGFKSSKNLQPGTAPYKARFYFNLFSTSRSQRMESYEDRVRIWDAWDQFGTAAGNAVAMPHAAPLTQGLGRDGSSHAVDGFYEVWMQTQAVLLSNSVTSISFSIAVAFAVLLLASHGDLVVALAGTMTLASSVACTLGTMYLLGWSLGAVEAVSATILCGIAVDYNIHLSIAFGETEPEEGTKNVDRVERALRTIGMSVFYGAVTTFLASSFLLLCTISILNRFGQFMMMVVAYSLVFAFFTQMALLSLDLPSKAWLRTAMRRIPNPPLGSLACWRVVYLAFLMGWVAAVLAVGLSFDGTAIGVGSSSTSEAALVVALLQPLPQAVFETSSIESLPENTWVQVKVPPSSSSFATGCAKPGSEYSFFVHYNASTSRGSSSSAVVVVEFEGRANAVCFDAATCAATSTFSTAINPKRFQRINAGVERFPFVQDAPGLHVYLPYCTGDAFLGNTRVNYTELVAVQHLGQANAQAAIQFVKRVMMPSRLNGGGSSTNPNVILQGCGAGAVGAVAHAHEFLTTTSSVGGGAGNVSVIADSMVLLDTFQLLAQSVWQSTLPAFSYDTLNASLAAHNGGEGSGGRLVVATSAYDWFQTAVYVGGTSGATTGQLRNQFKALVESSASSSYAHVVRVRGDRHCQVLNPVGDRLGMDSHLQPMIEAIYNPRTTTTSNNPINNAGVYKCSDPDCAVDADLR